MPDNTEKHIIDPFNNNQSRGYQPRQNKENKGDKHSSQESAEEAKKIHYPNKSNPPGPE